MPGVLPTVSFVRDPSDMHSPCKAGYTRLKTSTSMSHPWAISRMCEEPSGLDAAADKHSRRSRSSTSLSSTRRRICSSPLARRLIREGGSGTIVPILLSLSVSSSLTPLLLVLPFMSPSPIS